jgi:hypothetical protein
MPSPVPTSPAPLPRPSRLQVGSPISAGNAGQRWSSDLAFLLGHCVQPIVACALPPGAKSGSHEIAITYVRGPAVQVLVLSLELHPRATFSTGVYGTCNVNVQVNGVNASFVGRANGLDGSEALQIPRFGYRRPRPIRAYLDVSGLTVGNTSTVTLQFTDVDSSEGIGSVSLSECPIAVASPVTDPTGEVGIDGDWPVGGNPLWDGGASDPSGFPRLVSQLGKARNKVRRHVQLVTLQDTSYCWSTTATSSGALNWRLGSGGSGTQDPVFTIRPRRLYTVNDANNYKVHYWYRTNAAHDGELTFHTDNGSTPAADTTASLGASTSWVRDSVSVDIPTDADTCTVRVRGRTLTAGGVLYLAGICFVEDEV